MNLQPGSYVLCEVSQASWSQSVPNNAKCAAGAGLGGGGIALTVTSSGTFAGRSEERRVGKEGRGRRWEDQYEEEIITSDGTVPAGPKAWTSRADRDTNKANGVLDAAEFTAGPAASTTTNTSTGVWSSRRQHTS